MTKAKTSGKETENKGATIKISRSRQGGKKTGTDLFAHLRDVGHPLDDIIPQTVDGNDQQNVDGSISQTVDGNNSQTVDGNNSPNQPSAIFEISRPQNQETPSTNDNADGKPSTKGNQPSTTTENTSRIDGKTSAPKKVDVHKSQTLPSTKKDRHNKNLARYDNRIDSSLKRKIEIFCAENQFDQREFAELSAVHFMTAWTAGNLGNVDGKTAHDDRRVSSLWKTKPLIINLYLAYNLIFNEKSKWSVRDDEAGASFNNVDIRLIELGIIQTQANKSFTGKINSFKYYAPEIENFIKLNSPPESLQVILQITRQRWRQATGRELDLSFLEEGK